MSVARSSTPLKLKLLPELASAGPSAAENFGLPFSTFMALLVWNDAMRPNEALDALPRTSRLVRQAVSCSLRSIHRKHARRRAREQGMSVNAYLEALLAEQLARGGGALILFGKK